MDNAALKFPVEVVDRSQRELDRACRFAVNNNADLQAANDLMRSLKAMHTRIDDQRKAMKQPIDAAGRAVQEFFGRPLENIQAALGVMKGHVAAYLTRCEAEQRAAQEAADREVREARKALEAAAQVAEASGDIDTAEDLGMAALTIVAPVLAPAVGKLTGTSVREAWKFQVENAALIPRQYLMPDEKKIGGYVRAMRAEATIAGVRIWSEKQIATSGKGAT